MAMFRAGGGAEIYYLGEVSFTAHDMTFNVKSRLPNEYGSFKASNFIIGIVHTFSSSSHRERGATHDEDITHSYDASTGDLTISGGWYYYDTPGTLENGGKWGHHEDRLKVSVYLVTGKIKTV